MDDFTPEEEKFLKETFPAGSFSLLTIMVRNDELTKLMECLKVSGLRLALMPGVDAKMAFANPDTKGPEQ